MLSYCYQLQTDALRLPMSLARPDVCKCTAVINLSAVTLKFYFTGVKRVRGGAEGVIGLCKSITTCKHQLRRAESQLSAAWRICVFFQPALLPRNTHRDAGILPVGRSARNLAASITLKACRACIWINREEGRDNEVACLEERTRNEGEKGQSTSTMIGIGKKEKKPKDGYFNFRPVNGWTDENGTPGFPTS
ncbi:unnamed protein product [Cercopithifilaria johnstoni]|uniref:Uncharacterized protein n=1 Tax=Cercopithifilaria johnstoni TaxID=2874296 RepID=A0A8J2M270_9BILA|nr:unnamed protein product [Cercopithifilaria johnstoni]